MYYILAQEPYWSVNRNANEIRGKIAMISLILGCETLVSPKDSKAFKGLLRVFDFLVRLKPYIR